MAPAPAASAAAKASAASAKKARTTSTPNPSELMVDASVDDLEDEVREGPAANWEVAYVWAFVEHYTNHVDWRETNPSLPNVMTFEQALLDCSPPSTSSTRTSSRTKPKPLSAVAQRAALANGGRKNGRDASPADSLSSLEDDEVDPDEAAAVQAAVAEPIDPVPPVLAEDAPVPEASPIIRSLCELFQDNLKPIKELTDYHGKKTWFHFIINFVSNRFNSDPYYRGGFRWETNLLRTKGRKPGQETEQKFWMLRWEDKIHLMRIMVDYQLVNAPAVREIIKENYDIGNQRIAKRDPESNGLVVLPAGRTSTGLTLYHLDASPRLYASCDPFEADSAWLCLSSTLKGYKAFVKTLAAPTKADKKAQALRGPFAKAAAQAAAAAAAAQAGDSAKKGKGVEEQEDPKGEERVTRARLEADLVDMMEYEAAMDAIEQRKSRAAERLATRDARVARTLQRLSYQGTSTRSSRLRARGDTSRVHYDDPGEFDGETAASENGGGDDDDEQQGRRKRRRTGPSGAEVDGSEAGDDAASVGGSSRRSSVRPSVPGERRSNRVRLRDQQDDDGSSVKADDADVSMVDNAPAPAAVGHGVKGEEGGEGEGEGAAPSTVPATPAEGDAPVEPKLERANGDGGAANGHGGDDKPKPMEVDGAAAAAVEA
ncbi:uncharacterized protein RHOBADRAFT_56071 [Rhodotorula graminis WP1]|uniref:WHIM1 domain-containing protein n=1 Tax=Rhodotorula graminis (strain WP1) TaxID=578459 RepID=A0A0P9IS81_RHOGW|nr:uncharacterized protein RHOBADRAFT_56071 [Rhodotorula graminis WP1]KPV72259.1 hypothetical protein RHOBADRAFT_56071 [Rhodotorula graminis WP1]